MRYMSLCGSMLPQNSKSSTFRKFEVASNVIDASSSTSGAHKFPRAAPRKISLSSIRSDTARLKRTFSFCRRFSSFNWSIPIPPYCFTPPVISLLNNTYLPDRIKMGQSLLHRSSNYRNCDTISSGFSRLFVILGPPFMKYKSGPIQIDRLSLRDPS